MEFPPTYTLSGFILPLWIILKSLTIAHAKMEIIINFLELV